jgi:filamentous hemagglutinin family protein
MKPCLTPSLRTRLLASALTVACLAAAAPAAGQALPTGGAVTAGSAQIGLPQAGSLTVTQSSNRAVVDWKSFSIGQGGTVQFLQAPGAAILNRVTGADASVIAGALRGSGAVYLINPNGMAITKDGVVDVTGGFIGSTLGIRTDDFMAGRNIFSGKSAGAVRNDGRIQVGVGGFVGLLGGSVSNDGMIVAPQGRVELGAGHAATLDLNGDGFLQIVTPGAEAQASAGGGRQANGGMIALKASALRDAVRETVNIPGQLRARLVSGHDGAVTLSAGDGGVASVTVAASGTGAVSVAGTIDVSGGQRGGSISIDGGARLALSGTLKADGGAAGGRIDVTADDVSLTGATLTARGDLGGVVRIGGAFQGGRAQDLSQGDGLAYVGRFGPMAALRSATTLAVDGASHVDVSSTGDGAGGTAVLWSSQRTRMAGWIAAGDGAVEVSSQQNLAQIDLSRILLKPRGRLLLDPKNIIVGDGGDADPPDAVADEGFGANTGGDSVLWSTDVADFLKTGASLTLQASNDLTVRTPIVTGFGPTDSGNLTLQAGRSVEIDSVVQLNNSQLIVLANAPASAGVVDADRDPGFAALNVDGAQLLVSGGGVSLTMGDGAGNTNTDADSIHVGDVEGTNLTVVDQAPGSRIIFTRPIDSIGGALTITGDIQIAFAGSDFVVGSFNWTNESTAKITSESPGLFRIFDASGMVRAGRLTFSDPTRLALGPDTPGSYSRVYGDADPTATQDLLHIVAGDLKGADTLADILAPGSLVFDGPGAHAAAGSSSLTLRADVFGLDFATSERGYWIDTRPVSQPLTITPKTITASLSGASYTYGSPSAVANLNGLLSGDDVGLTGALSGLGAVTLGDTGSGFALGQRTAVGSRNLSLTGLTGPDAGNYSLDLTGLTPVNLTITPRTLTYTGSNLTSTYGTLATPGVGLSGIVAGDTVNPSSVEIASTAAGIAIGLSSRTHAGTYLIRAGGLSGADAGNYVLATDGLSNPTLTIGKLALTYDVGGAGVVYGDAVPQFLAGVLSGDDVTGVVGVNSGGGVVAWSPHTAIGAYTASLIGLTGANGGDYSIAASGNHNLGITITPRPLTLTASGGSFVYGTTAVSTTGLTGFVAGDDIQLQGAITDSGGHTVSFTTNTPVGSYFVNATGITGAAAGNYTFTPASATVSITPKPINYTISNGSAVYGDGGLSAGGVTLIGLLAGDAAAIGATVGVVDSHGAATALTAQTDAGVYTAQVTGLTTTTPGLLANYTLATSGNIDGVLTITPRPLTYSIPSGSLVYGSPGQVGNGFTLTGFAGTDLANPIWSLTGPGNVPVTLGATGVPGQAASLVAPGTSAGAYQIGISGLIGVNGFKSSNYTLSGTGGVLTITPKPLTYTVGAQSAPYGSTSLPGAQLNGVFGADNVVASGLVLLSGGGSVPFDPRTPVGTYNVGVTALSGAQAANYTLASSGNVDGTLTVVPKVLSWSVADVSAVYGDHPTPGAATLIGVVAGDTVSGLVTTFRPGTTAADLLNICNGGSCAVPVDLNPNAAALNAGAYPEMVTALLGADAANYRLSPSAQTGAQSQTLTLGTITFSPRPITLTVNDIAAAYSRPATPAYSITAGSFVNASDAPVVNAGAGQTAIQYSLPSGLLNVGTYSVSAQVFNGAAGNYAFTIVPGHLTIDPLRITAVVSSFQGTYGDARTDSFPSQVRATFTAQDGGPMGGLDPTYSVTTNNQPINGHYQVSAQGPWTLSVALNDPNYQLVSQTSGQFVVDKRPIGTNGTVQAVYGDSLSNLTPTGVLPGDDLSILIQSLTNSSGASIDVSNLWDSSGHVRPGVTSVPDVGQYQVSNFALRGGSAGNYSLDFGGQVQITPRTVTIVAVAPQSTTYGDLPTVGTANSFITYGNLVFGGDGALMVPAMQAFAANTPVGTHSWSAIPGELSFIGCSVFSDCVAHNYVLASSGNASASVQVFPRKLSWTIPDLTAVYGSPTAPSVVLNGVLPGDLAQLQTSLLFTDQFGRDLFTSVATSSGSSAFAVQLNKPSAGTYQMFLSGLSGAASGNYFLAVQTDFHGQLVIQPKPLTYTTADAVSYFGLTTGLGGSLDHFGDYTLNGVVAGDAVGLDLHIFINGQQEEVTQAAITLSHGGFRPGVFPISATRLTGPSASNYVLATSGNILGNLTSLDFTALNGLSLLGKPANEIINAAYDNAHPKPGAPSTTTGLNGPPDHQAFDSAATAVVNTSSGSGSPTTAGASTTLSVNSTSVTATAGANAGVSGRTDLGPLTLSGSATVEAWTGVSTALNDLHAGAEISADADYGVAFNCGNGSTCSLESSVEATVGATGEYSTMLDASDIGQHLNLTAGAGVTAHGGGEVSGGAGSIGGGGEVGIGAMVGIDAGSSLTSKDGKVTFSSTFEVELGVEIQIDFKVSIDTKTFSCVFAGCSTSYQVIADPYYAAQRVQLASMYQSKVETQRNEESSFVTKVVSGYYSQHPTYYEEDLKRVKAGEQSLVDQAAADGFSLKMNAGPFAITDNKPPALTTLTQTTEGIGDIIAGLF